MARTTTGPDLVNRFDASDHARERVRLVLATISGATTVVDAAGSLGISEAAFHKIRDTILEGALDAAEPKPIGRPPAPIVPTVDAAAEALRTQNQRLRIELEAARIREEIALTMPHLLQRRRKKNE